MNNNRTLEFGASYRSVEVGDIIYIADDEPLQLDCGASLEYIPIAYKTYGTLNANKDNAILVCHGLTGDQYLASPNPVTQKNGWWNEYVGAGKIIDTDKYFVICSNIIGGCMGSFGPKDIYPQTDQAYGLDFPVITIADMAKAQQRLIKKLDIPQLHCLIGGSMGGMIALEWLALFPEMVNSCVLVATAARHSAQNIAFHEIGRQAIMADSDWCGGKYIEERKYPAKGLAIARMTAHVTYLSEQALTNKFGRNLQKSDKFGYSFDVDFQIESYLRHQGAAFVERFDANSYLYITRAMDYFDLAQQYGGILANAFRGCRRTKICVIAMSSDWLFPPSESRLIVKGLIAADAPVSYALIETQKGHDAFLLDEGEFQKALSGFLGGISK